MVWQKAPRLNYLFLHAARLQAHHAAQWLARTARAHVPAQPSDGHTNLGWDGAFGGLVAHALPDGSRLGLRIADLTLVLLGDAAEALPLDGRTDSEVRGWLGRKLAARGLDAKKLDAPSPYDLPPHPVALGARYSLDELNDAFAALALWYANAGMALGAAQQKLAKRFKAPPVRGWPHHFDLDCLVALPRGRSMGIGFSPGDEYCDEPYFYTTIYPEPPIPKLPLLPQPGHWHTYQFLAAFAPAHKIVAADDQGGYVRTFLDASIAAALDAPS